MQKERKCNGERVGGALEQSWEVGRRSRGHSRALRKGGQGSGPREQGEGDREQAWSVEGPEEYRRWAWGRKVRDERGGLRAVIHC